MNRRDAAPHGWWRRPARPCRLAPALVLLVAATLAAPPPSWAQAGESGGIGGTGISQESGGIGGTGIAHETGGIGGTGISQESGGIGGTGAPIVGYGPIQRFGSVFVNGREYRVTARTLVTIDGRPATLASLHVGDMALVHGVASGAHGGFARSISSWQSIVGPVARVAPDRRSFTVLGQKVLAPRATSGLHGLRPGEIVGVSAQRQADGTWVAHRVTILPPSHDFRLETTVSAVGAGHLRLGGLELRAAPSMLSGLHPGDRVVATGTIRDGKPDLAALTPSPLKLGAPGTRIEVQNYFRTAGPGRLVAADGMEATGAAGARALSGLVPVEIDGRISPGGRIAIMTMTVELPEQPDGTPPGTTRPATGPRGQRAPIPTTETGARHRTEDNAGKLRTAEPPGGVEPPELGENAEAEPTEFEVPEIDVPETDLEAPEIETPTDQ